MLFAKARKVGLQVKEISTSEFVSGEKVQNLTDGGKCAMCGECCKDILPLDFVEVGRIEKYIRAHHISPQDHHVSSKTIDMVCPFLNYKTKKCVIYPVRPKICKGFICSLSSASLSALQAERQSAGQMLSMRAQFFGDDSQIRMAAQALFSNPVFKAMRKP